MPLPARPPATAPTAAPMAVPTGPATVPAAAPAAMPPAAAPRPVPTGCDPGAPVIGSRFASLPALGLSFAMAAPFDWEKGGCKGRASLQALQPFGERLRGVEAVERGAHRVAELLEALLRKRMRLEEQRD